AMIGFAAFAQGRPRFQTWGVLSVVLAVFLMLALYFGGLRGNRSNTVWSLFMAVGIIHFCVRPVPKPLIGVGLVFLVAFMYVYGLFKGAGLNAAVALESQEAHDAVVARTRRSMESTVLDDLGRADVQAFLLYRLSQPDSDYEYSLGRT